jgi:hypothetical protein
MGTPEWETQRIVEKLLASDKKQEEGRRAAVPDVVVGEYDVDGVEKRGLWLDRALAHMPAWRGGRAPGGSVLMLPNGVPVLAAKNKHGDIVELSPVVYGVEDIAPADWDARDELWQRQVRENENIALARYFGPGPCVEAGVMTAEEAAQLPPGLEGM